MINQVVLLVVYPSATQAIQAREVLVSGSRSDPSPRGAGFRVKKRSKPVRCCFGIKKDIASFKDDLI
jgi:hypothetical protein